MIELLLGAAWLLGSVCADEPGDTAPAIFKLPAAAARLADADDIRKRLGLSPAYDALPGFENVKVAVLDYGFEGFDGARAYLPPGAVIVENYPDDFVRRNRLGDPAYQKGFAPGNSHGRIMAQIVWATTGFSSKGPKFFLLNANGPTMLRRAVRFAVEQKTDVILFSGTFEGGGNFDGRGPINHIVDEAVHAGILWINAAGNYGRHVYNGPVKVGADGWLQLKAGADPTALRFRNLLDENAVTVTLNWNEYSDEEDAGATKDLDLFVEDGAGRLLASSTNRQVTKAREAGPDESRNPRERLTLADLPGDASRDYRIRVRAKSQNVAASDRIRILVTAAREAPYVDVKTKVETYPLNFLDATVGGEIFPPADDPQVITVGDAGAGSSIGPTADHRVKPDFLLEDSQAVFTNGDSSTGSSNAAAFLTGAVVTLKAVEPRLEARHLFHFVAPHSSVPTNAGRPTAAAAPGKEITLRQATAIGQGGIVAQVVRALDGGSAKAWITSDNQIVLGIDRSPADLVSLFPRFPQDRLRYIADDYQFYLKVQRTSRGTTLADYYRRRSGASTRPQAAPWEETGGRAADFVEVRKSFPDERSVSASLRLQPILLRRIWKTPSRLELAAVVEAIGPSPTPSPAAPASVGITFSGTPAPTPAPVPAPRNVTPMPPPPAPGMRSPR